MPRANALRRCISAHVWRRSLEALLHLKLCRHCRSWQYFSGVGNDPKDRHFRTVSQGQMYDPDAVFINMWLPELAGLPAEHAHEPWLAMPSSPSSSSPTVAGARVGEGQGEGASEGAYLAPLVPIATQLHHRPPPSHAAPA